MPTQRMISFDTGTDQGATQVTQALRDAFNELTQAAPDGVKLAWWRLAGSTRFIGLIELADAERNPLLEIGATRALPGRIGAHVPGGYPRPDVIEPVGCYGFGSEVP